MKIANQKIGKSFNPFIVAELSANHGGSIDRAKKCISVAKKVGASAVKIQSYTPDTMTIKSNKKDFKINSGLWKGRDLFDLYEEAYIPFEWHKELFEYAKKCGITIFSTPFDETAVNLLEELNTPAYKIASFELTDLPLIEYVAKKKKPIFLSTGMASLDEILDAVTTIKNCDNNQILLLHCISSYPSKTSESQLRNIDILQKEFNLLVGLSDHTRSNLASIMSIALGGVAVEKHFKLDSEDCGPDSNFSLLPEELESLVNDCNDAWLALGNKKFSRSKSEKQNKKFRRSLYFVKNLKAGELVKFGDVRRIRPGFGLSPKYFDNIIGKVLIKKVYRGDPVNWECFSEKK